MTKKFLKSLISSLLAVMMLVSLCAIPASAAVALNKTSVTLTKGYATTLTVSGTKSTIKWSTGDKTIATVSTAGKVSGKGVGSTYIYAQVSNTTLKCKVTVVAGKIVAGVSNLSMTAGESTKVNINAKGTHTISCSSSDKAVATATWNGATFDENDIPLTIKAVGKGTARIKVYAKNYPSTIYAYIDVKVTSAASTSDDVIILSSADSVKVNKDAATTFKVYTSTANSINVQVANTSIAQASLGSVSGKYTTINVKGISAGITTIRISSRTNSKNYVDIPVTVDASSSEYYVVSATVPSKNLANDLVLQFNVGNSIRYMLVPYNYDEAYANTLFASSTSSYSYYTVYTSTPSRLNSGDEIKNFTASSGSAYNTFTRYVLVPKNYDEAKFNTVVAQYKKVYEYYTIYNIAPTKLDAWDEIKTWQITDSSNGQTITRYMLVPYSDYVTNNSEAIIEADKASNQKYQYYVVYTSFPSGYNTGTDTVMYWKNPTQNIYKYMVVPAYNCDYITRNDKIYADTKVYNYFNIYSTSPTVKDSEKEEVITLLSGGKTVYMLIDKTDTKSDAKRTAGISGTFHETPDRKSVV